MKIRTRLYIIMGVAALTLTWYAAACFWNVAWISRNITKSEISRDIIKGVFELNVLRGDYQIYPGKRVYEQWQSRYHTLLSILERADRFFTGQTEKEDLAEARFHIERMNDFFERLREPHEAEISASLQGQLLQQSHESVTLVMGLSRKVNHQKNISLQIAVLLAVLFLFNALLIIVWGYFWMIRYVIRPVRGLHEGVMKIASGNLKHRVGVVGEDEISDLSRTFDHMTDRLVRTNELLTTELDARREAETKLREFNEDLEQRVHERTGELERLNQELAHSNQEMEQFLYVSSHDLQEPLRTISNYSDLFVMNYKEKVDPQGQEFLRHMQEGSLRAIELIRELLLYARIGIQDRERKLINLEGPLQKALENLKTAIEESGAVITYDHLPELAVDETEIVQLFQNLISNAVKYRSTEQPRIHISAARRDTHWIVSVKDNGIGIDPRYKEYVFMIFKRLHSRTEYPGTGIGLAICKKIIQNHGGGIWVESEPGRGSVFCFSLPGAAASSGNP